jgi:membrane protein YqaA with SNARE-associated domain
VSGKPWLSGWRLTVARILALLAVIAITIYIYSIRDKADQLKGYGYPGIFLLSVLGNATLILPAPVIAITYVMGAVFNPFGVAFAAGAGSAIGELTGYMAGFSGQGIAEQTPIYNRLKKWTERYGGLTITILALIPNPLFDIAGAAAGALKMPVLKFLLWVWIGKTLKMLLFALAGAYSLDWIIHLFGIQP